MPACTAAPRSLTNRPRNSFILLLSIAISSSFRFDLHSHLSCSRIHFLHKRTFISWHGVIAPSVLRHTVIAAPHFSVPPQSPSDHRSVVLVTSRTRKLVSFCQHNCLGERVIRCRPLCQSPLEPSLHLFREALPSL